MAKRKRNKKSYVLMGIHDQRDGSTYRVAIGVAVARNMRDAGKRLGGAVRPSTSGDRDQDSDESGIRFDPGPDTFAKIAAAYAEDFVTLPRGKKRDAEVARITELNRVYYANYKRFRLELVGSR